MTIKPLLARLLIFTILLTLLPPPMTTAQTPNREEPAAVQGLRFRLSEVATPAEKPATNPVAPASPLPDAETQKLLARLPDIKQEPDDTLNFQLRERSLPPPRAGQTIQAAFAATQPNDAPPRRTAAPLEVVRFTPVGEVPLAPTLSVTFSQPMVEVSSQEEAAAHVPVTLTPQPKGRWRWLGTQTLMFQPETEGGRLPMATDYTVTVPADAKSTFGNALGAAKTFTFATPPPRIKSSYPAGEAQPRDALMFLEFDQRIDPARVLASLRLQPAGVAQLRAATAEEIEGDETVKNLVRQATEGRWLVFRAVGAGGDAKNALPADSNIRVVVPPGTTSAEGPRATAKEQGFAFRTYSSLRVVETHCGYQKRCSPFDAFQLTLSNQIETKNFRPSQVKITPEIPDAKISAHYNSIVVQGAKRSNTNYTVTLDRALQDVFGQTLAGDNRLPFRVTTAEPSLFTTGTGFVVLDPAGRRALAVYSINYRQLRVRLRKVTPDDWAGFRAYGAARRQNLKSITPPGRLVFDKVIEVEGAPDELTETALDLSPALDEGFGQVFVEVEPVENRDRPITVYAHRENRVEAWVQSTRMALDAFADKEQLVAWANSLEDGRPLAGVELTMLPDNTGGVADARGLARLSFASLPNKGPALLVARRGADTAILPQQYYPYYYHDNQSSTWRRAEAKEALSWYVFDDRQMYRPGEAVHVKGWLRKINLTPTGGTELFAAANRDVNYLLRDAQGNEVAKGRATLNALAGFDFKVSLPATMNLGGANLQLDLGAGDSHHHHFQVQEFRRPEFEITTEASPAPHFVGSFATTTMTAGYYAGGALAATSFDWDVTSVPTNYTPPNRGDYTFGKFHPWWREQLENPQTQTQTFKGTTDAAGKHTLRIDFDGVNPPRPSSVTAQARVQDVNRQTLASTATLLVHPADVYVGLKSARTFVQRGESFDVSFIATDLDGQLLAGRDVKLRLVRLDNYYESGQWQQREADVQEQNVKSAAQAVSVRFATKNGGMYRLTAQVRDDRERLNESELSLWVAGGQLPPQREVAQERVELIPDRKSYAGNDTAEILVQSPFAPAEGVITLRRSGLLRTERFTMKEASYTLRVPLEEAMTPNLRVQVDLVGAAARVNDKGEAMANLPKRPAFASGEINLDIPPIARRLQVTAAPRDAVLEPGAETTVEVQVKDAQNQAVANTDTAVVVVDESVLALTDYKIADPLGVFYAQRGADVSDYHLRDKVKLDDPQEIEGLEQGVPGRGGAGGGTLGREARQMRYKLSSPRASATMADAAAVAETVTVAAPPPPPPGSAAQEAIQLRQNFNALAVFAASLPTDAQGRAQIKVKLPDNLTRYRITAVSVSGGQLFGTGEAAITARRPLMVRPSAPRFLNFGDRAELPVVLQNQTDAPLETSVAVRATNADLTEGAGRRVTVPANDRVEVRFPVAAVKPGAARFQVAVAAGAKTDAAEFSLPVYTPATTEAFATYGVIDGAGAVAQTVRAPAGAVKTFGGLEITTASTQLQELTDAVIYLYNYPYECTEQLSSRIISVAALKDVLAAFKAKDLPDAQQMRDAVARDIKRLQGLQNDDGGFDFWRRGARSVPFVSVHVAHALVRARDKDFAVPPEMIERSRAYLRQIEGKIPREYSAESKRAIRAYALRVRALMGERDANEARKLLREAGGAEKLSLEALGWLLPVLSGDAASSVQVAAIRQHINNRVTETAGAAHFADGYSDGAYTVLHSDRRADGVLLDALIGDQPQSDLIPKLVRGLLGGRRGGRWANTQENVFILLALDRYFQTYESATPDFTARVWLGDAYAGERKFEGRSVDRQQLNLPMSTLAERTAAAPAALTIDKQGAGRLYFRIGTQYAPTNLQLAAADYGFRVERRYEGVDDANDVRRDADGVWHVKAGARVRVRLTMFNPARRYHVALVDPLPAGLEGLNPELATTEKLPDEPGDAVPLRGAVGDHWFWWGPWYEHQNLRDERAEAFTSLLWEGAHEYTYLARATTPGLFVVPPAKAEEMYAPETFGRGQSDRVRVE